MKNDNASPVSVIIPVFNEEKKIEDCLQTIRTQNYPQKKIEILIIDDNSTDKTVMIAKKYDVKIFVNGSRNIEKGKSIGLSEAKSELILLMDADNRLPHKDWLKKLVTAMTENPQAVGAEAIWFYYDKTHTITDRYCELFGINDPMAYYLNRRDRLMATEKEWKLPGKIVKDSDDYYLIEFNQNNLPTIGSQGFLTRKSLLTKTKWKPYLFHMDSNIDLINLGQNQYLMIKDSIIHLHCRSIKQFIDKLKRNFSLFLEQEELRRYTWKIKPERLLLITLSMITLVKPLYDCIKGYRQKKDIAWFLHPIFCFWLPILYSFYIFRGFEFKKIFKK